MTDWTYRPGRGEANVALHDPSEQSGGRLAAVVSWTGDEHLLPYVPAAYFDKIFWNLGTIAKAEAEDLLRRAARFVDRIDPGDWESLLAGAAEPDRLTIPGKGGVPIPTAAVLDESAGKPYAGVKAKVRATHSNLGATTHFKPKLRGQNPTIAEIGFWALWDWRTVSLLRAEEYDVLAESFNSFAYQLRLYDAHGTPGLRKIGVAPFVAATAEASDGADLDYLIGRVRHELLDLATGEDGRPRAYPEWALRQFVKMQILLELGLLNAQIMSAYEVQRAAGGTAEQEAASGPYNAELDRAITDNELTSIVEEVFTAVTTQ